MTKEFSPEANQASYPFVLPTLNYDSNAFGSELSSQSFDYHYGKHHNAYVNNANKWLKENLETHKELEEKSLEEMVLISEKISSLKGLFNNIAQIWNHSFFWNCLTPEETKPSERMIAYIEESFGNLDNFKEQFIAAGASQFGSGWVWLCYDGSKLFIETSANANTPFTQGKWPILTCDVWEHAYYIDYRNKRPDFLTKFIENLVNWNFAEQNLKRALSA